MTLPFVLQIADKGAKQALLDNAHLLAGLNVFGGKVTYQAVAEDLGYDFAEPAAALKG